MGCIFYIPILCAISKLEVCELSCTARRISIYVVFQVSLMIYNFSNLFQLAKKILNLRISFRGKTHTVTTDHLKTFFIIFKTLATSLLIVIHFYDNMLFLFVPKTFKQDKKAHTDSYRHKPHFSLS